MLSSLRRQVRNALLAKGIASVVAMLVGLTVLVAFLDWAWHLDDVGLRLALACGIVASSGWVVLRHLVRPLQVKLTPVDLALRIEARHPIFREALASSVDFVEQHTDSRLGSPALQQAVIRDTLSRLEQVTVSDVVDPRPVRKLVTLAASICVLAGVLFGLNRPAAAIALQRLVMPLSAPAWPHETELRLLDSRFEPIVADRAHPLRIARGQKLRVFAENVSGSLPDRVTFEHRVGGSGEFVRERMQPAATRDAAGHGRDLVAIDLPATRGPIEFRATGGDDDTMPWHHVLVVAPPAVESFQVTLTPPEYVQRLAQQHLASGAGKAHLFFTTKRLPAGAGHIEALVGTQAQIEARSNRELQSAELLLSGDQAARIDVADDKRTITGSFQVTTPALGTYWIDLVDLDGVRSQESPRFEVRGIADAVPEVVLETPAADLVVTRDAEVPLQAVATDDLSVSLISLRFTISSGDETREPSAVTLFDRDSAALDKPDATPLVTRHVVQHRWSLADLNLREGDQILFHIEAEDDFDLSPEPHVGKSAVRSLKIVSPDQKRLELAQRQLSLLLELERAQKQEADAHRQVRELQQQNDKVGALRSQDLDALQQSDMQQRQVNEKLADPKESVAARARELLADLRQYKLDDPETRQRLERMEGELSRLGRDHVPPIEQGFTKARKQAQAATPDRKSALPGRLDGEPERSARKGQPTSPAARQLGESLAQVGEHQTAILESLGELLQSLSQWRDEQDIARELSELIADQSEIQKQTGAIGQRTLSRPLSELSAQDQTDLARLADRERRLAGEFEEWQRKLEETQKRQTQANPSAAGTLNETLEKSKQEPLAARMRDAAGQTQNNRTGESQQTQQRVLDKLQQLQDTLRGQEDSKSGDSLDQLRQAERDLAGLRQREAELRERLEKSFENPSASERESDQATIREEQRPLREDTSELARRFQRQGAPRGGEATRRAAERMRQAERYLDKSEPRVAEQLQQESLDDLEQAQRELARQRRALEEDAVRDQLAGLTATVQQLASQQERIAGDIHKLDESRSPRGTLTRTEQRTLRDLAATQRQVRQQADRLAGEIKGVFVFAETLRSAGKAMQRVTELLDQRITSEAARKPAEAAHQRLLDLLASLKESPIPKPNDFADESGGQGAGQPDEANRGQMKLEVVTIVPQLRLLKSWQQQVADRTQPLVESQANGKVSPDQQTELDDLAAEQASLRELLQKLIEFAASVGKEERDEKK
jgi:hypothetical protein